MSFERMWRSIICFLRSTLGYRTKSNTLARSIRHAQEPQNEGAQEEWKRMMFEEIAEMRDFSIHTGGRKRKSDNEEIK